jgi:hypothetical protein
MWAYVRFNDRETKKITRDYPGLRFGATGLTVVLTGGRFSVTHDQTGRSTGLRFDSLANAKRATVAAADLVDWTLPNAKTIRKARPSIVAELRHIIDILERR